MTYIVPISLGGLLVSIATLAWTVYQDVRKTGSRPTHQVVARVIPVQTTSANPLQPEIVDITPTPPHSHRSG